MRIAVFFLLAICAAILQADLASNSLTAITNVSVLTMEHSKILHDHTVLVRNGVVAELAPSAEIKVPSSAAKVDGKGFYLMPGLTDFHIHLRSLNELKSYLVHGVTTVVNFSGNPDVLATRQGILDRKIIGPMLFTSGPILDGDPPIYPRVSTVVTLPEQAGDVVREQMRAGYDFVKIYNNLQPDVLSAVMKAAEEHNAPIAGHIPRIAGRQQALQSALQLGLDLIAHGEEYFFTYFYANVESDLDRGVVPEIDESKIPEAVRMTKKSGTAVIPNLSFIAMTRKQLDDLDEVLKDREARYLDPEVLQMWKEQNPTRRKDLGRFDKREQAKYRFVKSLTRALNDGGVLLLAGTDASAAGLFPGKSLHLELKELVVAGLTEHEALATATINAGRFFEQHLPSTKPFGLIAPGHRADLLLLEGNPLTDIGNLSRISGVIIRGTYYTIAQLQNLRDR